MKPPLFLSFYIFIFLKMRKKAREGSGYLPFYAVLSNL